MRACARVTADAVETQTVGLLLQGVLLRAPPCTRKGQCPLTLFQSSFVQRELSAIARLRDCLASIAADRLRGEGAKNPPGVGEPSADWNIIGYCF